LPKFAAVEAGRAEFYKQKRRARREARKDTGATLGFEAKLWQAADKLRGSMDAAEYKHVVLGLIFLKYISDAFAERHLKLELQVSDPTHEYYIREPSERYVVLEDRDEYNAENVFWVPREARWSQLQDSAKQPAIGQEKRACQDAYHRQAHSSQVRLPAGGARASHSNRAQAGRAFLGRVGRLKAQQRNGQDNL
jgi:hypothetical protein